MITDPYVVGLTQIGVEDTPSVGRKAALLGELIRAGMRVPAGYVVTTQAQRIAEADGGPADLPADLAAALDRLADDLGDVAVAVRSSGVSEDLAGSSFAGQYDTVLDVRGRCDVERAIRKCWASARAEHVLAYQRANGVEHGSAMAVVVQEMVPAQAAGVAFSANPLTGDRDEVVVNAVRGLGERLVSGQASPDEWSVHDGTATRTAGSEDALDAGRIVEIADMARALEREFGHPQDIEWVFDGDRVWLVQARPITTLSETAPASTAIPVEVPPGTWTRETFTRRPWSPLQVSIFQPVLNRTTEGIAAFGMANGLEYRQIGGWPYSQLRALAQQDFGPRLDTVVDALDRDEHGQTIERWFDRWRAEFAERVAGVRASASSSSLVDRLRVLDALVEDLFTVHFRISSAGLYLVGEYGLCCDDELGWSLRRTAATIAGLPGMTTEPAFALAEIAATVRSEPAVAAALAAVQIGPTLDVAAALTTISPELATRFAQYVERYCHRVMGIDISQPTLAEQPWTVLRLLVDQVSSGYDPNAEALASAAAREQQIEEARSELSARADPELLARFDRLLARAQRAQPSRDDKAFFLASVRALVRYLALDVGAELARRGIVEQPDDVFFLEHDELVPALSGGSHTATVADRRANWTWATNHRGPATYNDPDAPGPAASDGAGKGPPAWVDQLPRRLRHPMTVLMWIYGSAAGTTPTATGADLAGVGASAGSYTGPVRVILGEDQFDELRSGDVLVCPETTPQWSVLFPKVGALITDTGGLLSHPAIIAREYRIPAVVATGTATDRLRSGQVVTVDGDTGSVSIVAG